MMLEAEIPISINSDAHSPIDVGMDFERAAKLAYEIGYNNVSGYECVDVAGAPAERGCAESDLNDQCSKIRGWSLSCSKASIKQRCPHEKGRKG